MAKNDLSAALNDCMDRLARGQSIEDCLLNYPDQAHELRPMLESGLLMHHVRISPGEVMQAKDRVRFRLEAHKRERRAIRPIGLARASGSLLVVGLLVFIGLGLLAENSLPGDLLYGLKRLTENVRQFASGNTLETQFAQRRVDEVASLLTKKRAVDVVFDGQLEAVIGSIWRVAGIPVNVASTTPGSSSVGIGDQIEVQGSTSTDGELTARTITLLTKAEPTPTMTPTISPTITPSPTTTPTQTATVTPSPTATITSSATSTMLPPKISTVTPTPKPLATLPPNPPAPTDDHGGGSSGSGDGGHDGSGSDSGSSGGGGDGPS